MKKRHSLWYVLRVLRDVAFWLFDGVVVLGVFRKESNSVVFVRVDGIGDFILWFGSIQLMRDHFHAAPSVLICNQGVVELARSCGHFDHVIPVDANAFIGRPLYRWKLLRSVRGLGAAVAVQPTFSRTFLTGDALIRATGAAKRIGSSGDLSNMRRWQRWVADRWYSDLVPAAEKPLAELERNCEFLRGMGIEDARPAVAELPRMAELAGPLRVSRDYFIVFPGAASTERIWPAEKFAVTARAVGNSYRWQMVVCGTKPERELADAVIGHAALVDAVNFAGMTSLLEFIELVRGARLLIGNETSALHIAAAVGTPSVGLLGGGHFDRFMPYSPLVSGTKPVPVFERMECFGCNWRCVKSYEKGSAVPCIAAIEVTAAVDAVHRALGRKETL